MFNPMAKLAIFIILVTYSLLAQAQNQALENAKQFYDTGQNLYLKGNYPKAAQQFMKAYEIKAFPAFLFNVAVCHEKMEDFKKALQLYRRYLKEDTQSPDYNLVTTRIKSIEKHLKTISPSLPQSLPERDPGDRDGLLRRSRCGPPNLEHHRRVTGALALGAAMGWARRRDPCGPSGR